MPLDPPLCVKLAGRPKKARRRAIDEVKKKGGKYVIPSQGSQRESNLEGTTTLVGAIKMVGVVDVDAVETSTSQSTSQATPKRYIGP
ncbi:hypothetical protein LIER_19174 [Lithospermum erythrorhizon]|uniref:Uncharacterized protein n=1 Tax=Lithospermum erythrorhizon TaxID=34254 RepID=A0AAV3QJU2_LITER